MIYSTCGQHPRPQTQKKSPLRQLKLTKCKCLFRLIYSSICMQLGSDFNFILMVIFTDIGRSFGFGLLMLFYLLPFYKRYEHTNTITALWGRFSRNIFTKLRGTLTKQLGLNQHK